MRSPLTISSSSSSSPLWSKQATTTGFFFFFFFSVSSSLSLATWRFPISGSDSTVSCFSFSRFFFLVFSLTTSFSSSDSDSGGGVSILSFFFFFFFFFSFATSSSGSDSSLSLSFFFFFFLSLSLLTYCLYTYTARIKSRIFVWRTAAGRLGSGATSPEFPNVANQYFLPTELPPACNARTSSMLNVDMEIDLMRWLISRWMPEHSVQTKVLVLHTTVVAPFAPQSRHDLLAFTMRTSRRMLAIFSSSFLFEVLDIVRKCRQHTIK
mmetsp:Transcript_44779/g.87771  ORF Transcript_44779/g.87771 Transcript_44779/m.87771 type:complete len:266 (-) Transcript_44779:12-809(-)